MEDILTNLMNDSDYSDEPTFAEPLLSAFARFSGATEDFIGPMNKPTGESRVTWIGAVQRFLTKYNTLLVSDDLKLARKLEVVAPTVFAGHEHGTSAGLRNSAMRTMDRYAKELGKTPVAISASGREASLGWKTQRRVYCTRDLIYTVDDEPLSSDALVFMVDVDYYVSTRQFSEFAGRTIVMYTVQPQTISGTNADCQFCIDEGGLYNETISGGASFTHRLWDYGKDWITIDEPTSAVKPASWNGAFWVYDVHRKVLGGPSGSRALVFLVPRVRVAMSPVVYNWASSLFLPRGQVALKKQPLERWGKSVVHKDGMLFASFTSGANTNVSVRFATPYATAATVPLALFQHLVTAAESKCPGLATVERIAEKHNVKLSEGDTATLAAATQKAYRPEYYINYTTDAVERGRPLKALTAQPIVPPATAMTASDENLQDSKLRRFTDYVNNTVPPKHYNGYSKEFGDMLFTRQTIPTDWVSSKELVSKTRIQQARTKDMERTTARGERKSVVFMKAEEVMGGMEGNKAGRIIYTLEQEVQVLGTQLTTAVKEGLSEHSWFMVGKTPETLAEEVHAYVAPLAEVELTDFSKMDATISPWMRKCYGNWIRRGIKKEAHHLVSAYLRHTENVKVRFGSTTADSGASNLSGAPDTTLLNTLVNAFVDYCSLREAGFSAREAFDRIGPKYGDDGISDPGVKLMLSAVAAAIGMTIKVDSIVPNGVKAVEFLSRVYVDAWTSTSSFACVPRALAKIPVGPAHKPLMVALADKVSGYLVTDAQAPILGPYLRALQRVYGLATVTDFSDPDMVRRTTGGPYPFDPNDADAARCLAELSLGLALGDGLILEDRLDRAETVEDLRACRLFDPIDYSSNVVS